MGNLRTQQLKKERLELIKRLSKRRRRTRRRYQTYEEERLHGCAKPIRYIQKDGCWVCTSHFVNRREKEQGYVVIHRNSKAIALHRHIWQLENKRYLKPGEVIKMTCKNPSCMNPIHMKLDDKHRRIGHLKRKLTMVQADTIRIEYGNGGVTQQALAVKFGVCQKTISSIINDKHYQNDPQ